MSLVIADCGELLMLAKLLNGSPENLTLKLYTNNYTPLAASVAGSFTEATFTGYSATTLTAGSWGATTTISGKAVSTYASQTFTCSSGSETIYGYYVVGATSGTLYFGERFTTATTLTSGNSINVIPSLSLNSEN